MATHYAYVLCQTGGEGDPQGLRPVSLDPWLDTLNWGDATGTDDPKYAGLEPDLVLVVIKEDEVTLDAINAAPGNFELARGGIVIVGDDEVLDESSLEVTLTNKDKNDLIAIFQARIDNAGVSRRTALTNYASSLGVELAGMSKKQALIRLARAINEMVNL